MIRKILTIILISMFLISATGLSAFSMIDPLTRDHLRPPARVERLDENKNDVDDLIEGLTQGVLLEDWKHLGTGQEASAYKGFIMEIEGTGGKLSSKVPLSVIKRISLNPPETYRTFLRHIILKVLDEHFLSEGYYTKSHITYPLGSFDDGYYYEYAEGTEGWLTTIRNMETGNPHEPVKMIELFKATGKFLTFGFNIGYDIVDANDSSGGGGKNIIHEGWDADGAYDTFEISKDWKRIDFGTISCPFSVDKCIEQINAQSDSLKEKLGWKYDLIRLIADKLKKSVSDEDIPDEDRLNALIKRFRQEAIAILQSPLRRLADDNRNGTDDLKEDLEATEYFSTGGKVDFAEWEYVPGSDCNMIREKDRPSIIAQRDPDGKFAVFSGGLPGWPKDMPIEKLIHILAENVHLERDPFTRINVVTELGRLYANQASKRIKVDLAALENMLECTFFKEEFSAGRLRNPEWDDHYNINVFGEGYDGAVRRAARQALAFVYATKANKKTMTPGSYEKKLEAMGFKAKEAERFLSITKSQDVFFSEGEKVDLHTEWEYVPDSNYEEIRQRNNNSIIAKRVRGGKFAVFSGGMPNDGFKGKEEGKPSIPDSDGILEQLLAQKKSGTKLLGQVKQNHSLQKAFALVVDGEEDRRKALALKLRNLCGFDKVYEAENQSQANAVIQEQKANIVLVINNLHNQPLKITGLLPGVTPTAILDIKEAGDTILQLLKAV